MTLKTGFYAWFFALIIMIALDAVWLGYLMADYFQSKLAHLMADDVAFLPAALFYLSYAIGIAVLAVKPAIERASARQAVILGAVFGFTAYGTYDFVNWATLRDWPADMSSVDIAWGTVATAFTSWGAYRLCTLIARNRA